MSGPLVSIIIPCFRQAHFLRATVESVLSQSYSPVEIIVVNDGSDDDTEAVARSFGDKIKYHWQPNAGLPAARNTAISLATGKYILCLDSDDLLHPDAVRWLVEAADNRDDVLCLMGLKRFKVDPAIDGGEDCLPPADGSLAIRLMSGNIGSPHAFMFSRSMINAIGGFTTNVKLKGCEDWDMWLRLVYAGAKIVPIPRVGAYHRQHLTSMSKNLVLMANTEAETLWQTSRWVIANPSKVASMGGNARDVRKEIGQELFYRGYILRENGRHLDAARAYWRSIRCGGLKASVLTGLAQLIPHWVLRRSSAPSEPVREGATAKL